MTTYPQAGDPQSAGTLAGGATISHKTEHGRTIGIWENAKHHGAVGDATVSNYNTTATDDTAAIQAALDAAAGQVCYLPPQEHAYRITDTLVVPSGTVFRGGGPGEGGLGNGTKIFVDNVGAPALLVEGGSTGTVIKDMYVSGDCQELILLDGSAGAPIAHTIIDGVYLAGGDTSHFGIDATWALETYISRCHGASLRGGAVHIGDTSNGSTIRDCAFSNGGLTGQIGGILIEATGVLVQGNVVEAFRGDYGIKVTGASSCNVIRNWFEDCNGIGIWVTGGGTDCTNIIGNNTSLYDAFSTHSLKVDSTSTVFIEGNDFAGGGTAIVALTSSVPIPTRAFIGSNVIFSSTNGDINTSGLVNANDVVVRLADRRDSLTAVAVEVLVGHVRLGTTSEIQWGPSANAAPDTIISRFAANVIALGSNDSLATGGAAHGSLPSPAGYAAPAQYYCLTHKLPVWSDGSAHWVDAAGSNHT